MSYVFSSLEYFNRQDYISKNYNTVSVGFITYIDVVYVTIIAQRKGGIELY